MVKRVVIPNAGFCKLTGLLRIWKHLEEISIGCFLSNNTFEDLLNMNSYPNNLTKLNLRGVRCLSFTLTEHNSNLTAKCLHQLKVLSIENYDVHKDGVRTILHECKNLSRLNIESCRRTWPSAERVFGIRRKDPSTMITGKIEKKIHGENVRWSIDSMERLFSLEEVLDHLFISN